jgi:hypothetical protein
MCERCVELDGKIAHMRLLAVRVTDKITLEGFAILIDQYQSQKRLLHPEGKD